MSMSTTRQRIIVLDCCFSLLHLVSWVACTRVAGFARTETKRKVSMGIRSPVSTTTRVCIVFTRIVRVVATGVVIVTIRTITSLWEVPTTVVVATTIVTAAMVATVVTVAIATVAIVTGIVNAMVVVGGMVLRCCWSSQ